VVMIGFTAHSIILTPTISSANTMAWTFASDKGVNWIAVEVKSANPTGNSAQLVSSLTNKSELKAYYSMDSTNMSSLYSTDFTSDSNNALWSEQDTSTIGISDSNDRIDFEIRRNASNDSMSYDLGKTLDSEKWTMRCKLKFTRFCHTSRWWNCWIYRIK